jgi:hypothetical protein
VLEPGFHDSDPRARLTIRRGGLTGRSIPPRNTARVARVNAAAITQMAVTLTQDMLNEQPPDDGHRLNILSSSFRYVRISVLRDASGTVWMTQDFSG